MALKEVKILAVDDDPTVCDLLQQDLTERGYKCSTVLNSYDALARLAAEPFDLVLLDIRLPGTSGMDILPLLHQHYPNTAVVMITAVNDVETAVKAVKLGASDYIAKPFHIDKLEATVRTVLQEHLHAAETEMDAIALGVETNLDQSGSYSKAVTQRTLEIARRLEIPEEDILGWAEARRLREAQKRSRVQSALNKLETNPMAQQALGVMEPYSHSSQAVRGN